ncbi:MAG: class I SAM-dependent methyltransferase, partial [Caldilineaceae bacterium]|nr:class I SAM-dependent methyltransferase [Caldilineaceae bacterium]
MNLELAHVLSYADAAGRVQEFGSGATYESVPSAAILEYGIPVHAGDFVAVDRAVDPPQIVFRWLIATVETVTDTQIRVVDDSGYEQNVRPTAGLDLTLHPGDRVLLAGDVYGVVEGEAPLHADQLRRVAFPMIESMYARVVHAGSAEMRETVRKSYDAIAEDFLAWTQQVRADERERYTTYLLDTLPPHAEVLELGCGAGIPTTQRLAERFRVTGVDISDKQIELARRHVARAEFVRADMMDLSFAADQFDAVAAFYSIVHVPREDQPQLLRNLYTWLRPGGLLVISLGAHAQRAGYEEDWLGAPMYWSSFDAETNVRMIEEAGFHVLGAERETAT